MQDELEPGQPVQHFAFGGIANPAQSTFLRGVDRKFLEARQAELDEFERQRLAYNDALTKWQTEVYNPYVEQVNAFNTAAQKYNTEVYNPYKAQVDAYNDALTKYNQEVYDPYAAQYAEYEKAVNAWNAGSRESDYAGPGAPTLARSFDMTLPTQPEAFSMTAPTAPADFSMAAPVLPFKEEDVIAYQQSAAERARKDASNRAVAIDVVSNPDQFNFGSMSVSNRFMAEGGPVEKEPMGQARKMMDDLSAPDDDAALMRMLGEITSKGKLSKDQVMEAVDRVAAAGRGGDELLAYLSPESMAVLKKMGGAGTINPATGLPEFKGGVIGRVARGVRRLFGRSDRAPAMQQDGGAAATPVAQAPAAAPAPEQVQQPTAADLMKQLDEARAANTALETKYAADLKAQQEAAAAAQQEAIAAALKADAENRAKAALPMSQAATPTSASDLSNLLKAGPSTSPATTAPGVYPDDFVGPIPPGAKRESEVLGTKPAIQAGPKLISSTPAPSRPEPEAPKKVVDPRRDPMSPDFVGPRTPEQQAAFNPPAPVAPQPIIRDQITPLPGISQPGLPVAPQPDIRRPVGINPVAPTPYTPITQIPSVQPLDPEFLRNISRYDPATRRALVLERERDMGLAPRPAPPPGLRDVSDTFVDLPRVYGPGQQPSQGIGPVGSIGAIPIGGVSTPSMPLFGGSRPTGQQQQATNPSNYFAQSQPAFQGGTPGTISAPYNPLAMNQGPSPQNMIAVNPNLSPAMLGGQQNAGVMVDRLGNRIYAPGMVMPPGFAKGGQVDIDAMRALVDASNMADEEEGPTVDDYASEAKRMLASLQPSGQTQKMSRTRLPATGGGAETPKEMGMEAGSLTERQEFKPKKAKSAQAELRALAKQYALKQRAAENQARGLMQNTLGAPTLEQPTLTKEGLSAKRFQKGGEAKKADAGEVKEPSLFGVSDYATRVSARMFPDQLGQDDERDAARHMLAAATLTRKYGPKAAELLGKAHEYTSNPRTFFSAFGVGEARDDLPYDLHNNQVGMELAARSKSQAELEKLVEAMARQSQFKQTAGRPWIMSEEAKQERLRRFQEQQKRLNEPPEYKHGGAVKRHA